MDVRTMSDEVRSSIRHTLGLFGVLEAKHALLKLEAGLVEGELWCNPETQCGCLIGSLLEPILQHKAKTGFELQDLIMKYTQSMDRKGYLSTKPAQRWFRMIRPGDKPSNNEYAKLAAECMQEWISEQVVDVGKDLATVTKVV